MEVYRGSEPQGEMSGFSDKSMKIKDKISFGASQDKRGECQCFFFVCFFTKEKATGQFDTCKLKEGEDGAFWYQLLHS